VKLAVGSVVMIGKREVSGKRDSNPRPSAWEADALPLSYSRMSAVMPISAEVLCGISTSNSHSDTAWEASTLPLSYTRN
jgi:hypothetical protein